MSPDKIGEFRVYKAKRIKPLANERRLRDLFGDEAATPLIASGEPRDMYGRLIQVRKPLPEAERRALQVHFGLVEASEAVNPELVEQGLRSLRAGAGFSIESFIIQLPQESFIVEPVENPSEGYQQVYSLGRPSNVL